MSTRTLLAVGLVILGLSSAASAQRGIMASGYCMMCAHHGMGGRNYDPATEVTLTGMVDEVKQTMAPGWGAGGLHFTLNTTDGVVAVHVGPLSFVRAKSVTFASGDALTILGSRIQMGGQEVLIPREIRKGDQVLTLRDANGRPLWSGCGCF
jgi:hypothetical protein